MAKPDQKPPHGMEPYDLGGHEDLGQVLAGLNNVQQAKLNDFKVSTFN